MDLNPTDLFSDIARSGPPLFFPDPPVPVTFNFDQGIAAEETFPMEEFSKLSQEVLDEEGARALEYISFGYDEASSTLEYLPSYIELVLGHTGLREQVAAWLGKRNSRPDLVADGVILTSGSVQAIALAMNAFVDSGDGVIVESASFPYALRYLQMRGANIASVPIDQGGMDIDELERQILDFKKAGVRPKLIYTIPTFQLPTCVVMPLERRERLMDLATRHQIVVIEDNIYGDLRYEGEPLPTLLSLDQSGLVLQSHGFSKVLAPGIRLGWMAGAPEMIAGLAAVRQDLGVSQWFARMMSRYLANGRLDPHIDEVNAVYRRKRDVAVQAVRDHCTPWVSFDVPEGGFYLWLELSEGVDWERAQQEAILGGVLCRPGEVFMGDESGAQFLRLAYSHVSEDELQRGIAVLGKAIASAVR